MIIQFLNSEDWGIDQRAFSPFIRRLTDAIDVYEGNLNVVFVNDDYIRALNKAYRKKDKATDVLSFNYQEGDFSDDHSALIGEIYISVETAKRQAIDAHHSLQDELNKLFVHGFLHIHGYDHEKDEDYKVMHGIETAVLEKVRSR